MNLIVAVLFSLLSFLPLSSAQAALDTADLARIYSNDAEASASVLNTETDAQPGYLYSKTNCSAYTSCHDNYGNYIGQISCYSYGYQYMATRGLPYSGTNSCMWRTIPYTAVQCAGYQQVWDPYSQRTIWAWNNASFRCPGR